MDYSTCGNCYCSGPSKTCTCSCHEFENESPTDKILVSGEDHCIACQGKCTNDDPGDYNHMLVEHEALTGAWIDRGASPSDIWSFLAAVLIHMAHINDVTEEEFEEVMRVAWRKYEADDS